MKQPLSIEAAVTAAVNKVQIPSGFVFEHPETWQEMPAEKFGEVLHEMAKKHGLNSYEFTELAGSVIASPAGPIYVGMQPLPDGLSADEMARELDRMVVRAVETSGAYHRTVRLIEPTGMFYADVNRGMNADQAAALIKALLHKEPDSYVPGGWHRAPAECRTMTSAGSQCVVGTEPVAICFGPKTGTGHIEGVVSNLGFNYEDIGGRSHIDVHYAGKHVAVPTGRYVDRTAQWDALFPDRNQFPDSRVGTISRIGNMIGRALGRE